MEFLSRTPRTAFRALVAVVVAWLAAGSTASAGCGDYIHILPPAESAVERHPAPPNPIDHGRCEKPMPPVPTTPAEAVERDQRVPDALVEHQTAEATSVGRFAVSDEDAEPRHFARLIFHPPRG